MAGAAAVCKTQDNQSNSHASIHTIAQRNILAFYSLYPSFHTTLNLPVE